MGRPSRTVLTIPDAMLPNRKPPASLLRPKPRPVRKVLGGIGLFLAGGLLGLMLGIGLQVAPPAPDTSGARPDTPPGDLAQRADPRLAAAATDPAARDAGRQEAGRQAEAAEYLRMAAATQARVEAEARLDALRRELAAASTQRDATRREAAPPPLAAPAAVPAPRAAPVDPPRESAARRETLPPPAAAPAPGPAPLRLNRPETYGGSGSPRVVVHHRAGSVSGAQTAAAMAEQLREAGFEAGELRSVAAVPAQRVVRYFHTDDAPAAARLAGRLGRGWAIQDFRSFDPSPSPGLLEVWLPER